MMKFFLFLFLMMQMQSCFLFPKFKKESFSFNENGQQKSYAVVIPKGFTKSEKRIDSSGNEEQVYYYLGGTSLYFVRVADTSVQYQPINYELNIPKEIYNTTFFKRLDSANRFWRETRFANYKLGYRSAKNGDDWRFDSALNYFSIHSVK